MQHNSKMNPRELRSSLSLASILFFRLFGLFLILPIFSIHALKMQHATPMLVGLAFGIYGLTQACLQIPFGMCSDKFGRKPIILLGLLIFVLGSLLASIAESIWLMIFARAIQGAGAISAVLLSLLTDLTREQQRIKAMALIGIGIFLAFSLAFTIAPILNSIIGMSGIFLLTAVLATLSIIILYLIVPNPEQAPSLASNKLSLNTLKTVIKVRSLYKLNIGAFVLHSVLMANFTVVPIALQDKAGLAAADHWQIYLPVLILSIMTIAPFIMRSIDNNTLMRYIRIAICILLASQISFFLFHTSFVALFIALLLFFIAFNYLEATIPSLISIFVRHKHKGAALGVHASSQFMGVFTGGLIGGTLYQYLGLASVFVFGSIAVIAWLLLTFLADK